MTTWFTRLVVGSLALATLNLTACKKDESQLVISPTTAPTLKVSTTSPDLALTLTNASATAATFTYSAADFGYQSITTYTLQIDKKGGDFSKAKTFNGGTAPGTISLTTSQLVRAFTDLGLPYSTTSQVDVRVIATVGTTAPKETSQVVTLTGTPTPVCIPDNSNLSWGLVGPAGDGWPGATATDRVLTYDCYTQTYKLHTTLNAGAFKFRANKDWGTNLGGVGTSYNTGVTLSLNGADLVTTGGTYDITLAVDITAGKVTGGTVTLQ